MPHDDTPRSSSHIGAMSAEDRLERIENAIDDLGKKLDAIRQGLSDGSTRFATLDLTITSLTHRVQRLEEGRDLVVKIVMTAVVVGVLGLLGIKAFG